MKKFIVLIVMFVALMSSCQSKSGKLAQIPFEKVVIVDSYHSNYMSDNGCVKYYKYKVKRLEHDVVTFISVTGLYEKNDTIYYCFINGGN